MHARVLIAFAVILTSTYAVAAKSESDAERAAGLKQNKLTLQQCIESAIDTAGGTAVFANVHIGKRGKFRVNVDGYTDGEGWTVDINETGDAQKKKGTNRARREQPDYAKITAEFEQRNTTLQELVNIAETETKGTAINAWGYVENDKVLVRVIVVVNDESKKIVIDPATKKLVP